MTFKPNRTVVLPVHPHSKLIEWLFQGITAVFSVIKTVLTSLNSTIHICVLSLCSVLIIWFCIILVAADWNGMLRERHTCSSINSTINMERFQFSLVNYSEPHASCKRMGYKLNILSHCVRFSRRLVRRETSLLGYKKVLIFWLYILIIYPATKLWDEP